MQLLTGKGREDVDLLNNDNGKKQKRSAGFTILSNDANDGHGGYGAGTLNLDQVTPLFIDVEAEEAFIDMGAMHARSEVEKRVKFIPDADAVPKEGEKAYWLVWITIGVKDKQPYYAGVAGCYMTVNKKAKRGYKNLPEHVNYMDKSIKGHILVDHMDVRSRAVLKDFLKAHNEAMWHHADAKLHQDLDV